MNRLNGRLKSAICTGFFCIIAGPAWGISCQEGYQRVRGEFIATPYCQDAYLAEVAASYGMRAPATKIRDNPNFKREVCRLVGQDIRVQSNCQQDLPSGRSGRF